MSKITNLIGTTWRLGDKPFDGIVSAYGLFQVDAIGTLFATEDGQSGSFDNVTVYIIAPGYIEFGTSANAVLVQMSVPGVYDDPTNFNIGSFDTSTLVLEITFTGGKDISNPLFIDFINTYGTLVSGGESSNKVEYNGAVIASLEAGQTATLQCANKKAVSDITITFVSAGTIAYNGTETSVEAGKTATFKCAGKKMLSDVAIVIAPAEEEPTIIKLETPVIELIVEGEETDEPQLTAPAVELDGTTLNIYDDEGIATSYDILVDGVVMDTVEVDAEPTLPVWNGTDLTGTTWYVPAGWNATAGYGKFSDLNYGFAINGEDYGGSGWSYLCIGYYGNEVDWYGKTNSIAYSLPSEITDDSSITLTFTGGTDATNASLIAWLKENGELTSHIMPDPVLISFTVKGASYQAEEIMTWAQWCNSDYNTQGAYLLSCASGNAVHWDGGDGVSFNAVCTVDSTTVLETDIVIANHAYSTKSVRHTGGAG